MCAAQKNSQRLCTTFSSTKKRLKYWGIVSQINSYSHVLNLSLRMTVELIEKCKYHYQTPHLNRYFCTKNVCTNKNRISRVKEPKQKQLLSKSLQLWGLQTEVKMMDYCSAVEGRNQNSTNLLFVNVTWEQIFLRARKNTP